MCAEVGYLGSITYSYDRFPLLTVRSRQPRAEQSGLSRSSGSRGVASNAPGSWRDHLLNSETSPALLVRDS